LFADVDVEDTPVTVTFADDEEWVLVILSIGILLPVQADLLLSLLLVPIATLLLQLLVQEDVLL